MTEGGYVMVNGTGIDISAESSTTITGLFREINEALKSFKPVILYGCVNDDEPITPMWVNVELLSSGSYQLSTGVIDIAVTDADVVTVDSAVPQPTPPEPSDVFTLVDGTGITIVGSSTGTAAFFNAMKTAIASGKPVFIDKLEISSGDPGASPVAASGTYNSAYDIIRCIIGNKYVILAGAADNYSITIS